MRRFRDYPLYVNDASALQDLRRAGQASFAEVGDAVMVKYLDDLSAADERFAVAKIAAPGADAVAYENAVCGLLAVIAGTRIGKLLLGALNPAIKVWIVPLSRPTQERCSCVGLTWRSRPSSGGGVLIRFLPGDVTGPSGDIFSPDDVLFHEMVHAYRIGFDERLDRKEKNTPMADDKDLAEFFAHHMQNVYLSQRNSPHFYKSYLNARSASRATLYTDFVDNEEVLRGLKYFLRFDPLTRDVAEWHGLGEDFNPWRDFRALQDEFLRRHPEKGPSIIPMHS